MAIDKDHADALRQLLQLGCDVNVREKGLTLLTYALSRRSYACALVMLDDSRCDVNAQAHNAAHNHPLEYVLFNTRNCNMAQEISQRTEVLKRLLERGLQADCQSGGWTPLNHCVRHGLSMHASMPVQGIGLCLALLCNSREIVFVDAGAEDTPYCTTAC